MTHYQQSATLKQRPYDTLQTSKLQLFTEYYYYPSQWRMRARGEYCVALPPKLFNFGSIHSLKTSKHHAILSKAKKLQNVFCSVL